MSWKLCFIKGLLLLLLCSDSLFDVSTVFPRISCLLPSWLVEVVDSWVERAKGMNRCVEF